MGRRILLITFPTVGLLAFTGCASSETPTLTTQRFESVTDLQAAVANRGIGCDSDTIAHGGGYKESLKCGDKTWLTIFETSADKEARIEIYEERNSTYIEGQNWVIVAPKEILQEVTS